MEDYRCHQTEELKRAISGILVLEHDLEGVVREQKEGLERKEYNGTSSGVNPHTY